MSKARFAAAVSCLGAIATLLVVASLILSPSASLAQTNPTAEAEATLAALGTVDAMFTATAVADAQATAAAQAEATARARNFDATREAIRAVETMQAQATLPPPAAPESGFDRLLRLARAVPANTPLYAVIRADGEYIAALDALLGRVLDAFAPFELLPGRVAVSELLDQVTLLLLDVPFESGVRPWLGDTIAFGVQSLDVLYDNAWENDAYVSAGAFIAIRDRTQAQRALERRLNALGSDRYIPQRLGRALIYVPRDEFINTLFVIEDEWLAVTTRGYFDYLREQDARPAPLLSSDARFMAALDRLPAPGYNGLVYVDLPQFVLADGPRRVQTRLERLALTRGIAPTLIGATLLDGYTLTLDIVQPPGDVSLMGALGIRWDGAVAVEPAFASLIPGNTIYALHGTNLSGAYRFLTDNAGALLTVAAPEAFPDALAQVGEAALDIPAKLATAALLGLDFEADVLSALTGDYLLFVMDNPAFRLNTRPVLPPLDFGLALEMTDLSIAARVAERLERELPATTRALGVPARFTRYDRMGFTGFAMRYVDRQIDAELLVVYNADFFFVGTPGGLASMLRRDAPFLDDTTRHTLPEASLNLYMRNSNALRLMQIALREGNVDAETTALLETLLRLLDRGIISLVRTVDGHGLLRMTLTLSDPRAFAPGAVMAIPTATMTFTAIPTATPTATLTLTPTETPTPTLSPEEAGRQFLAQNARAEGVVTTESGLQYRIVRRGDSTITPGPTDTVTVHYRGTLLDGTEFDSSYSRGQPATFPVFGVIEGWVEGLQYMSPGDVFILYLPPALAYGSRSPSPLIPPNSTLIFEVELLEIN